MLLLLFPFDWSVKHALNEFCTHDSTLPLVLIIELSSLAPIKAKLTGFRKVLYSWGKKSAKSVGKIKRSLHPFQLIEMKHNTFKTGHSQHN